MTAVEYLNRKTPEYSDTMFLEGYSPTMILAAAHKKMIENYTEEQSDDTEVVISSEIEVK